MLNAQASAVVHRCTQLGLTLATAESLTAGLCAATIAEVPGASNVLRGGLVVYATDLKATLAGVSQDLLDEVGPISPDVARELAAGAAQNCGAHIGLGLTGVAGPDPQDGHPVGEIYVAVSVQDHIEVRCIADEVETLRFKGAFNQLEGAEVRSRIRSLAVDCALFDTLRSIDQYYGNK